MKIKDLLEFNPEADIKIIFENGMPYEGLLDYGWSNGEGDTISNDKNMASEVCIFLGTKLEI